jgi:hypothetical protein
MTIYRDWRELPFREIWCVDTEFYPGPGKDNGGRDGDASTPRCLVAHEMRSGRTVRLWQDELGPFPPYRLDADALIIGYMISAEFGTQIALGWGEPARGLDPYIEFRHYVNDGAAKAEDRDKGFFDRRRAALFLRRRARRYLQARHARSDPAEPAVYQRRTARHSGILRERRAGTGTPDSAYRANDPLAAARTVPRQISMGHGTN